MNWVSPWVESMEGTGEAMRLFANVNAYYYSKLLHYVIFILPTIITYKSGHRMRQYYTLRRNSLLGSITVAGRFLGSTYFLFISRHASAHKKHNLVRMARHTGIIMPDLQQLFCCVRPPSGFHMM